MINLRVAEVLAHEIHGTAWESACLNKGLDPAGATADEVIGKMTGDMWDANGKRVLPYDDEQYAEILEELEAEPVALFQDPKTFVREVTEVAGLTKQEARVVGAIVDGSPIPDGKNYTGPLARRLNTTPKAVRNAWEKARKKLRDNWAAE